MAAVHWYFANICQGVEHWWVAYLTLIGITPIMNSYLPYSTYSYRFPLQGIIASTKLCCLVTVTCVNNLPKFMTW